MAERLTIGKLARAADVGVETVRFYQRRGLIAQPRKPQQGFRGYDLEAVERIRFIREAQALGFTLREVAELLALRADPATDCAAIRKQAEAKLMGVEAKARRLDAIREALKTLIAACPGKGSTVSCSILDAFNGRTHATDTDNAFTPARANGPMKTLALTVSGMHCAGCAETIRSLLTLEDGVATVTVSHDEGVVRILYDPAATDPERLVTVIERAGYSASRGAE